MSQQTDHLYEFGPFLVNTVKRRLLREGHPVPVTSKVFDTLLVLVEHSGEVLAKDELMKALWPDTVVEENNLTQQISMLRKALGERAQDHRYVVTVPGRGYSFVAQVREVCDSGTEWMLEEHTRSEIIVDLEEEGEERQAKPEEEEKLYPPSAATSPAPRWKMLSVVIASVLALFAGLGIASYRWIESSSRREASSASVKSIAVLPFKDLNAASSEDYLGSGMADTLIARLSNIRQISVRPTSAVIKYADEDQNALAAGRQLGVDSVLEGTVQRSGDRVRVTVQLVSVRESRPLWAQSFDERFTNIFTVQDSISEQVARAMLPELTGDEQLRLKKRYTESVEAYQAYVKGRYFWNKRTGEGARKSLAYFQQAIDLDPAYSLAYAGLADAYSVIGYYRFKSILSPDESYERARAAALKALEIDDSLAEAHASLANIKSVYDGDDDGAEKEYKRAIELNPNYATAHHWYSDHLGKLGRDEEAMTEIKLALELDPLSPIIITTLGERLHYARQYDQAIEQFQKALELDSDFIAAHYLLGLAYEQKGSYEQAIAELQKASSLSGNNTRILSSLGHAYAISGKRSEARKMLNQLMSITHDSPFELALLFDSLGDKEHALQLLQKLYEDHKGQYAVTILFRVDPRLDDLRSDPKFKSMLHA